MSELGVGDHTVTRCDEFFCFFLTHTDINIHFIDFRDLISLISGCQVRRFGTEYTEHRLFTVDGNFLCGKQSAVDTAASCHTNKAVLLDMGDDHTDLIDMCIQ